MNNYIILKTGGNKTINYVAGPKQIAKFIIYLFGKD